MRRWIHGAALASALLATGGAARADDITEGLDRTRQLYEAGDLAGAVTELGFAVSALHQKRSEQYSKLFPPAPAGWTLGEAEDTAGNALAAQMMGGGVMVARSYTRGDDSEIKATVIVDSPLIQALAAMAKNPAMLGSNAKRVRIGGDNAILEREADSDEAELTLVRNNVAVKLEGSGLKDAEILTALMKGFDLAKLQNPQGK
ncbi:hypothetical protein [Teichococcus oryzae]|uniref:Uncharacterized protein n=1 Tax=Teichococcus oryzae TaxID=1608942 RepID=A0A5B2TL75_9PROT|nr:hypothetical protein [Pseudoroseomonas oryzae]KAA2214785.1 hypothetical protein F0Q34_03605 [Pseudoroseomonas oryzae]